MQLVLICLETGVLLLKELESDTYQRKSRGSTDSHNQDVYNMYINKLSEQQIENEELKRTQQRQNPDGDWKASTTSQNGLKTELNKAVNENQLLKYENDNLKKKIRELQQEVNKKDLIKSGDNNDAYIGKLETENERLLEKLAEVARGSR